MTLTPGTRVRLVTPDNPRLDGAPGIVTSVTDWGAHVHTDAAVTGRFRAAWSEMLIEPTPEASPNGDVCPTCGGVRLVRNGSCLLCLDCGESSGCS